MEEYPHNSYLVVIPCLTSDDEEIILDVEVNLTEPDLRPRKLFFTQTWLDNYYRPAVMKKVEILVRNRTLADMKAPSQMFLEHLQTIANNVFTDIIPPQ